MSAWQIDVLTEIAGTDDLHVSPLREDGVSCGTPTWIWSVVLDGVLYVRAYNGTASRWYQSAMQQKAGRTRAAGMTADVTFGRVEGVINDQIDAAYEAKYAHCPYLAPMIGKRARAATVRIEPKGDEA